jgi:hypothetical protein
MHGTDMVLILPQFHLLRESVLNLSTPCIAAGQVKRRQRYESESTLS